MQIGVETSKAVDNKRVFVVDSDEITRAALQFMLHDENETHEFADLDAALRKAEQWRPDLLILNAALVLGSAPDLIANLKARITGLKVLVAIEAATAPSLARGPRLDPIGEAATAPSLARGPRLDPIGEGGATDARALRQAGADGVLHKPLTIEGARMAVDVALGRRRATIAIQAV